MGGKLGWAGSRCPSLDLSAGSTASGRRSWRPTSTPPHGSSSHRETAALLYTQRLPGIFDSLLFSRACPHLAWFESPAAIMNCPSRVDPIFTEGWNQNPDALNADATTRADLNHMANARLQQDHRIDPADALALKTEPTERNASKELDSTAKSKGFDSQGDVVPRRDKSSCVVNSSPSHDPAGKTSKLNHDCRSIRGLSRTVLDGFAQIRESHWTRLHGSRCIHRSR